MQVSVWPLEMTVILCLCTHRLTLPMTVILCPGMYNSAVQERAWVRGT